MAGPRTCSGGPGPRRAGFRRSGDHYTRRTLVDSTAFDDIYETHSVRAYQHYVPKPPFDIPDEIKALSGGDAAGMRNPALVQALVGQASEKMQDRLTEIFGGSTEGEGPAKVSIAVNAYAL